MVDKWHGIVVRKTFFIFCYRNLTSPSPATYLQVPDESRIVPHLLEVLEPFSVNNGGPLVIETLVYKDNRPNLKITYPGTDSDADALG